MKRQATGDFRVGDIAVYPAHGVGKISSIEHREISGSKQQFYIMQIFANGMTVMVPTKNVKNVGLREVVGEDQVDIVYEILQERDISIDNQTWNRRYREYMDKIRTGSIFEIAEVLRDLMLLRYQKELSFGERKMLDTARNLLIKELAIAEDLTEKEVAEKIDGTFEG